MQLRVKTLRDNANKDSNVTRRKPYRKLSQPANCEATMVPNDSAVIAACSSALPQPMACSRGMTMELKLYSSNELELVATPTSARISTRQPRLNSVLSKPFMVGALSRCR
ncbi:hypothetical protein D3C85_745420 [compost metagenome]